MSDRKLTREEISILLYIETRAVDHCGRIDAEQMNDADREILKRWNDEGFVQSGRICAKDAIRGGALWAWLSPEAFGLAHLERWKRAERCWESRGYQTTAEKQGRAVGPDVVTQ